MFFAVDKKKEGGGREMRSNDSCKSAALRLAGEGGLFSHSTRREKGKKKKKKMGGETCWGFRK